MRYHYYYLKQKGVVIQIKVGWCGQQFFTVGPPRTFSRLMCSVTLRREIPRTVLARGISSWGSFPGGGDSVPRGNTLLDVLLQRTELENQTLAPCSATRPPALGLLPAGLRHSPSASLCQLKLPGTKPVFHHLRYPSGRQGNVLGGQSIGQRFLCLPGYHPSHAVRLKQNVTPLPLRSDLSSASATS